MGSDESPFNVSLIVRGKVAETVSVNHNLLKREERQNRIKLRSFCLLAERLTARPNRHTGGGGRCQSLHQFSTQLRTNDFSGDSRRPLRKYYEFSGVSRILLRKYYEFSGISRRLLMNYYEFSGISGRLLRKYYEFSGISGGSTMSFQASAEDC